MRRPRPFALRIEPALTANAALGALVASAAALATALSCTLLAPRGAHAALGEEIPTGHQISARIRRLEAAAGLLPLHSRTEPVTRGEVLAALRATGGSLRAGADSAWIASLRAEILEELALESGPSSAQCEATLRAGLRSRFEADPGGDSRLRETARVEAAADLTSSLCLFESFEVDTDGGRDADFEGRRWRDALTARVDRAGIALTAGPAAILAGRSASRWGASDRGGLILSPESPPLDLVRLRFDFGPVRLSSIASALDEIPGDPATASPQKRRFSAHRLDVRIPPTLNVGLSETVVYGGPNRGFEAGYLVPFFSYYAEAWNGSEDDNVLWGIDAVWSARPGALIRGELLIDDFQYDLKTEPHQVGWTVGGDWAPPRGPKRALLSIEYTRIETFVYGHFLARNRYLHDGVVLGDPLGPDSDRLGGSASWDVADRATFSLSLARERRGAQRADSPQETAANPRGLSFPSPPVRRAAQAALSASWRPRVTRRVDASIGYEDDEAGRAGWSGWLAVTLRIDRRLTIEP